MSSTRRVDPNEPLSQERYMSSPEFAELQAISGTAVAKRCALLESPAKRELLWFYQGLSLPQYGGLRRVAKEWIANFPSRFVVPDRKELEGVNPNLWDPSRRYDPRLQPAPLTRQECERFALGRTWGYEDRAQSIEEFLVDICINPAVIHWLDEAHERGTDAECERVLEQFPDLKERDVGPAWLCYFDDVIGVLVQYKRQYEERVKADFCHTAVSQEIWKQLDYALKSKTMIVLDGREGRGKTEAVRAWCDCHLGVARFLSLKGTNTKTAHFREFARALGFGHGNSHKVSQMQSNVEEVLQTSGLMLVIDEAHFFFNQAPRMKTRPEMLDYIDTAFCNPPLPLALVTTPQFMICMERAASQVGWNYRQFKRRCKRYCRLPVKNTPEDIEAVARHLLPAADKATIKLVVGYGALSKRDLSAVGDVVREAKVLAEEAGAKKVGFEHVNRAIHEVLFVSDEPWAEMEKRLRDKQRGRKAMLEAPALAPEPVQERLDPPERDVSPRLFPGAPSGSRMRFRTADPALAVAEDLPALTPA